MDEIDEDTQTAMQLYQDTIKKWFEKVKVFFKGYDIRGEFYDFVLRDDALHDACAWTCEYIDHFKSTFAWSHFVDENELHTILYSIVYSLYVGLLSLEKRNDPDKFVDRFIGNFVDDLDSYPNILCEIEDRLYEKVKATYVIQRYWTRAVSNPRYELCRKRLMREFTELT